MKKNNLKLVLFILSFGAAFNISSMEETEKVREKEEIKEKRKNFFEDEQELKQVKLDDEKSYLEKLPSELQTMLAEFVAGSVKDKEEAKEAMKNLSNLAQTNKQLREIIKSDEFQKYLLKLVNKNISELSRLDRLILIGTPYWANRLREVVEKNEVIEEKLIFDLMQAVYDRNIDKVKFLLKAGIDPSVKNFSLLAAVLWAADEGNGFKDIAKFLIKRGGNFNIPDRYTEIPLIAAVGKNYTNLARLLLDKGADPNIKSRSCIGSACLINVIQFGETPLIIAAKAGYKDMVELLLNAGADPNIKNYWGTPLMQASAENNKEIVRLLLSRGALNVIPDMDGDTPLIAASRKGNKDIVELLLNAGADPNIKNDEGNTALMEATKKRNKEIVKLLLEHSYNSNVINLNIKNNKGHTALMIASRLKNREIMKLLLNAEADPNIQDNQGNTALTIAVHARAGKETIRLLLTAGADPTIQNNNGQTALSIAEEKQYQLILEMLRKNIAAQALTGLS